MAAPSESAVVHRLRAAGCVDAELEAAELLGTAPDAGTLEAWLRRREQGEPVAWIVGSVSFGGGRVRVAPGVYVPRPHSEVLARHAAERLPRRGHAVDLCTGTGAIAASVLRTVPDAVVVGVDLDPRAARCARRNGVRTVVGDVAEPIAGDGRWDLVAAVAPYVPTGALRLLPADVQRYEPRVALDGGDDGLDLVRLVVHAASRLLRPGGWIVTELGGDQDAAARPLLADRGFDDVETWHDDDGDLRGILAQRRQRYSARSR